MGRTKEYLRMILRSTRGSVVVDIKQERKVLCCSKVVELLFLRGLRVTYDVLWFLSIRVIVTAAFPYPALRLDKLYAALIRCLVLWTVTKQILVFLF